MKRGKKFFAVLLSAIVVMALILTGCNSGTPATDSPAADPTPAAPDSTATPAADDPAPVSAAPKGEITIILQLLAMDISPFGGDSSSRNTAKHQLYSFLFSSPRMGAAVEELEGEVAKSYEFISDDTIQVEIYDYVYDHKGNHITANDVKELYEYATTQGDWSKLASSMKSISVVDEYTVEIVADQPGAGTWQTILTLVPIVSWEWFQAASDAEKTSDPACTGSYHITDFVAGSTATLEPVENFWQTDLEARSYHHGQPLERINYVIITEDAQRTIAMENGEADGSGVSSQAVTRFQNADGTPADGYNVLEYNNGRYSMFMFNCDPDPAINSPFSTELGESARLLRQAILYAIDFEEVMLGYGMSKGELMHDFCVNVAGDYNAKWDDENYFDYDPERAKELFAEAGYAPGELSLRLMCTNVSTTIAGNTVIQSQLGDNLGIDVEILAYDQALYNTYKFDSTQWDIITDNIYTLGFVTDAWMFRLDNRGFSNGTGNFVHDDRLQELLMAAHTEQTPEARDEFHYYLMEQAYVAGMFFEWRYYVTQDGVENIRLDGNSMPAIPDWTFSADYETVVG